MGDFNIGGGSVSIHTGSPGVNDDKTKGYLPGHQWLDDSTSPHTVHTCIDNATSAAVWNELTLGGSDSCFVHLTGNETLANTAQHDLPFDAEFFDDNNMHDNVTDPERITIVTPGKYLAGGVIRFTSNNNGYRNARIDFVIASPPGTKRVLSTLHPAQGEVTDIQCVMPGTVKAQAGDYFKLSGKQTSGGNLDVIGGDELTSFWVFRIG